jgi:hypothetical protein
MINQNINYHISSRANARYINTTALELNGIGAPHNLTKYIIEDSFNNRKDIAKVAKNVAGVYIFQTPSVGLYVGSST